MLMIGGLLFQTMRRNMIQSDEHVWANIMIVSEGVLEILSLDTVSEGILRPQRFAKVTSVQEVTHHRGAGGRIHKMRFCSCVAAL